jgi:hypothetical protein
VAFLAALGGLASFLQWLKIEPKDLRAMSASIGWPHWLTLIFGLVLFTISLVASFYAVHLNRSHINSLEQSHAKIISELRQSHADGIRQINNQHQSEQSRSNQIRDIALADARAAHDRIKELETQLAAEKTPLAPASDVPTSGPKVRATRYGRGADGHYGLFVSNIGDDPAFDVSIPTLKVGAAELDFWNEFPGLDKSDGEVLFAAQLTLPNGNGRDGGGLRDELIRANLESITVDIRYRDFDKQWYVTRCELARDVYHGIRAGTVGREFAAPPLPHAAPVANFNERPDKATSNDWNDLAAKFEKIPNDASAELQTDRQNGTITRQEWRFSGLPDTRTCESLCRYGGALLLKSPKVLATVSPEVVAIPGLADRWLVFLKDNHNAADTRDALQSLTNENGYSVRLEVIRRVQEKSMQACIDCAALER